MTDTALKQAWIRIAAAMLVAQHLAVFIVHPITALSGISLVATVLLALFLLRGSRVAWVLSMFSAVGLLIAPFTMDQPVWFTGIAAILLACLLSPASRAFVWAEREESGQRRSAARLYGWVMVKFYALLGRAPWLNNESRSSEGVDSFSLPRLILLLGICIAVLYPLIGLFYEFHRGSGSDSVLVNVTWEVVWRFFSLIQLAFIIMLVIGAYRYFTSRDGTSSGSGN